MMKRINFLLFLALTTGCVAVTPSCTFTGGEIAVDEQNLEQTSAHSHFSMTTELPKGRDRVSAAIREELKKVIDDRLSRITSYEGERFFEPFDGDGSDTAAYLEYYFNQAAQVIARFSDEDAAERASYIEADEDLTEERKAEILAEAPTWEYEFNLKKLDETADYAVFQSLDYIYMGGAHGGMLGDGCLTFSKKDGHLLQEVLNPDCEEAIQPLIAKGLAEYFSDGGDVVTPENYRDFLLIDDDVVPLPAWQPYPAKDGLVFTYQQYEIAPYAAGMPSFTVPKADIAPFLSADARKVFGW